MNRALHGSCHVPVAALARLDGMQLQLQGLVGSAEDGSAVRAEETGDAAQAEAIGTAVARRLLDAGRSEEHTSELQSLMRISYAVFCLKKKNNTELIKALC